jgi:hypothetical protein
MARMIARNPLDRAGVFGKADAAMPQSLARAILTDLQFWIPAAVLVVGVLLLILIR